jgi:hypothetical protein
MRQQLSFDGRNHIFIVLPESLSLLPHRRKELNKYFLNK